MTSMITATAWVPRGHAAAFPTKYVFDEDEYARISKLAKLELEDAKDDLERARGALGRSNGDTAGEKLPQAEKDGDSSEDENLEDDDLKEYDMEHYDDEPDVPGEDDDEPSGGVFGNIRSLAYHTDNNDDPYLTLPDNGEASDEEEREELQILPTDSIVLAARIEDEVAHLEVYVYEDEADNLYVHHDVMLPAIPLCVEWLGTRVGRAGEASSAEGGNFAAVGTMDPDIELWDLDVVDCMYPNAVLGQNPHGDGGGNNPLAIPEPLSKKRKKKSKKPNPSFHVDSVLSLAANRSHRNLLASASADHTIKLWDLTTCTAAASYSHHTDKACALAWHPSQTSVLLSGSYDRTVAATDMRAPSSAVPRWGVESDVEQVRCDPLREHIFYAGTESGILHCFDARAAPTSPESSSSLWRLQAHGKSLSALSINPAVPGFLVTGSTDRTVKIWDCGRVTGEGEGGNTTTTAAAAAAAAGPSLVVSRDLGVGKVFAANFAPDEGLAFRLAVAGSKGAVQVWDTSTNRAVREAFATRATLPALGEGEVRERMVGVEEDGEVEEEEEEADAEENGGEGGWESMDED